ncbi:MAG: hexulose-6-phosphate isomerase [Chloroflexi bacterium]|nr:hexulose-6-phosphate isomerase [Chloroflexota bacterium]
MRRRHRRTLEAIFRHPTQSGIRWDDIESLLLACGADIEERARSRIGIELNGVRAHSHRPHPRPEATRGAVEAMRRFLREAGIEP